MRKINLVVKKDDDLLAYLQQYTDYSKSKLKAFIKYNCITLNDKIIKKIPQEVKKDDKLSINLDMKENLPFDIVYEDQEIIVVNKKAGLLTVAIPGEVQVTLYRMVREYANKRHFMVFIVNRLDKDTSGLVMFAKSERIKRLYQDNWNALAIKRKYLAVVEGKISKDGQIDNFLYEESNTLVHSSKCGKRAITNYHVLKSNREYTLLDIDIETGRKNQIRVHMSELGHPIVGDKKYGSQKDPLKRMALHAYALNIKHPLTGKIQCFSVPQDSSFIKLLK